MKRIPVAGPWITEREITYVSDAVANAWYEDSNVYNDRFERAFADYVGAKFAISLPSCTSAIHLSLCALGVGPGDEVIVPDVTWIATAAPIAYVGARPVFADIDPVTWCLSAESFKALITPRTKAVIPVDLFGGTPDWDAICRIAADYGIAVIEDAAEAIGSEYKGQKAGSFGKAGVFSFHGSKTLTTGEGGMLVTNCEQLCARARFLRDHGRHAGDKRFYNTELAYKYKMSSMQAALGLAQLERVDDLVARKRDIFSWYQARLCQAPEITLNAEPHDTINSYWMVTVLIDYAGRSKFAWMDLLDQQGIDTRPVFTPLSSLPPFREEAGVARSQNIVSQHVGSVGINLPSALRLSEKDVDYVCKCLLGHLGQNRRAA